MKTKILAALKIKFKNLGFSDKAFEGVADYLATTITEEDQIETGIAGVEPMFKAFQGDADNRVNTAVEKAKAKKAEEEEGGANPTKKKKTVKPSDDDDDDADDTPAWAKRLEERLSKFEQGQTTESRMQKLQAKLEGVHDSIKDTVLKNFKYAKFDSDEEFSAYMEEIGTTVEAANQSLEANSLGASKPIFGSQDSKTGVSSAVQNFIESKKNGTGGELAGKEI